MWFDRVTGCTVLQLPDIIESSRFVSLDSVLINGHTKIGSGAVLVDDGSGELRGVQVKNSFRKAEESEDMLVESNIVNNVLLEFERALKNGKKASFLIPESLLNRLHLQAFDALVKETIEKGHLQEISRSPKMELIYQELMLPIGRVKKFSPVAGRHLAAHSECWQKRSFTGVVPRSLLALESEDEYNIYENKAYARLLDHLDRYLQRRCAEVSRIEEAISEAASFEASEDLYFDLIHSVCRLWGEGFKGNQVVTDEAEQGQGTLQVLRSLLREVRGLRGSKLYRAVPKGDDIGFQIRMTNTLTHDQHYRHVARLWNLWLEYSKENRVDPAVKYQHNTLNAHAYFTYTEALVERSLSELGGTHSSEGFLMPGGRSIKISEEFNTINLDLAGSRLSVVPLYDAVTCEEITDFLTARQDRIVLTPAFVDFKLENPAQTASPLYFHTLEAMTSRLSSWLSLNTVSVVSDELTKLPIVVTSLLKSKYSDYFIFEGTGARLRKPLGNLLSTVLSELMSVSRSNSIAGFLISFKSYTDRMEALLSCPICGETVDSHAFQPRDDRAFEVSSSSCGHYWRIDKDRTSRRFFVAGPIADARLHRSGISFPHYGRFSYQVELP